MKSFSYSLSILILCACSGNSIDNKNCRFLLDIPVNINVNLNLPQYSQLQFINNPVYIPNVGNAGIIANNTGTGFVAFDAADPNHIPEGCSKLSIDGIIGVCGCNDKNEYYLTPGGLPKTIGLQCALRAYRVEKSGNTLLIYN